MIISQNSFIKLEAVHEVCNSNYIVFDSFSNIFYFIDDIIDFNKFKDNNHLFIFHNKFEFLELQTDKNLLQNKLKQIINEYDYIKNFKVYIIDIILKYDFFDRNIIEIEIAKILNIYNELKTFFISFDNVLPDDFLSSIERKNKKDVLKNILYNKRKYLLDNTNDKIEKLNIKKEFLKIEEYLFNDDVLRKYKIQSIKINKYYDSINPKKNDDLEEIDDYGIDGYEIEDAISILEDYLKKMFFNKFTEEYKSKYIIELENDNISKKKRNYLLGMIKDINRILKFKFKDEILLDISNNINVLNNNKSSLLKYKNDIFNKFMKYSLDDIDIEKLSNAKRIYTYFENSLKYNNFYSNNNRIEVIEYKIIKNEDDIIDTHKLFFKNHFDNINDDNINLIF